MSAVPQGRVGAPLHTTVRAPLVVRANNLGNSMTVLRKYCQLRRSNPEARLPQPGAVLSNRGPSPDSEEPMFASSDQQIARNLLQRTLRLARQNGVTDPQSLGLLRNMLSSPETGTKLLDGMAATIIKRVSDGQSPQPSLPSIEEMASSPFRDVRRAHEELPFGQAGSSSSAVLRQLPRRRRAAFSRPFSRASDRLEPPGIARSSDGPSERIAIPGPAQGTPATTSRSDDIGLPQPRRAVTFGSLSVAAVPPEGIQSEVGDADVTLQVRSAVSGGGGKAKKAKKGRLFVRRESILPAASGPNGGQGEGAQDAGRSTRRSSPGVRVYDASLINELRERFNDFRSIRVLLERLSRTTSAADEEREATYDDDDDDNSWFSPELCMRALRTADGTEYEAILSRGPVVRAFAWRPMNAVDVIIEDDEDLSLMTNILTRFGPTIFTELQFYVIHNSMTSVGRRIVLCFFVVNLIPSKARLTGTGGRGMYRNRLGSTEVQDRLILKWLQVIRKKLPFGHNPYVQLIYTKIILRLSHLWMRQRGIGEVVCLGRPVLSQFQVARTDAMGDEPMQDEEPSADRASSIRQQGLEASAEREHRSSQGSNASVLTQLQVALDHVRAFVVHLHSRRAFTLIREVLAEQKQSVAGHSGTDAPIEAVLKTGREFRCPAFFHPDAIAEHLILKMISENMDAKSLMARCSAICRAINLSGVMFGTDMDLVRTCVTEALAPFAMAAPQPRNRWEVLWPFRPL